MRIKSILRAAGKIALYAITGVAAQKYGTEFAEMVSDRLTEGVTGEYATPLAAKLGAVTTVNAVANKLRR